MAIQTDEQRKAMFAKQNKPKADIRPTLLERAKKFRADRKAIREAEQKQKLSETKVKIDEVEKELEQKRKEVESQRKLKEMEVAKHRQLQEEQERLAASKKELEKYTWTGKLKRGAKATGAAFGRGATFVGKSAYRGGKAGFKKLQEYESKSDREPRSYQRRQSKSTQRIRQVHRKKHPKKKGEFENIFDL